MLKRTLTAILLIPPVVYLIGWSPKWLFLLAVVVAVVLALREYFGLVPRHGHSRSSPDRLWAASVVCAPRKRCRGRVNHSAITFLLVAFLLLISTLAMRPSMDLKDYLAATSATIFGILYIGLSLSCLVPIRFPGGFIRRRAWTRGGTANRWRWAPARSSFCFCSWRFGRETSARIWWAGHLAEHPFSPASLPAKPGKARWRA